MTCDPEHKFELSVQLGDLKTAYTIAKEIEVCYIYIVAPTLGWMSDLCHDLFISPSEILLIQYYLLLFKLSKT